MKIEGQFHFPEAPPSEVWSFLTTPDRIARCLPGCETLSPAGDDSYEMTMIIGIGSIRGKFTGTIRLHDVRPTSDYRMTVSGRGGPGFINGEGILNISSVDGGTQVAYSGNVAAGGAIASVGQRMISGAARMVIDQFFRRVAENLNSPTA